MGTRSGLASLASILVLVGPAFPHHAAAEPSAPCAAAAPHIIARQFDRWNAALAAGDADAVARLYTEDARLHITASTAPIVGRAAIRAYFAGFLTRHPQGTLRMRSITVGCNSAFDAGTYVYRITGRRKGTRMLIVGRYTTHYEYRDGHWLIAHHQG
jgi:uncharacterized protein (TIGR02246 family)